MAENYLFLEILSLDVRNLIFLDRTYPSLQNGAVHSKALFNQNICQSH